MKISNSAIDVDLREDAESALAILTAFLAFPLDMFAHARTDPAPEVRDALKQDDLD